MSPAPTVRVGQKQQRFVAEAHPDRRGHESDRGDAWGRIDRLRVLLYVRNAPRPWGTPVVPTSNIPLHLNPWPAERPDGSGGLDLVRIRAVKQVKQEYLGSNP